MKEKEKKKKVCLLYMRNTSHISRILDYTDSLSCRQLSPTIVGDHSIAEQLLHLPSQGAEYKIEQVLFLSVPS